MKSLLLLWSLRLVLCALIPQYGYIQPDEFFQSVEPIAADVLQTEAYIAWELNTTFALRNIAIQHLLYYPVFKFIKLIQLNNNPFALLIGVRIIITLMSYLCDYSIYLICKSISKPYYASLVIFSSSYVTITYLTHTFSNSIETILLSLLLASVIKSIYSNNYSNNVIISVILSLAFFNRPTFPLFAAIPTLFWIFWTRNEKLRLNSIFWRIISLIPWFLFTSLILTFFDTIYYKSNLMHIIDDLVDYRFSNIFTDIVLTPLNFIEYNTKRSNLANHGLHAPYFHALINVPLAFSLLGIFAYFDSIKSLKHIIVKRAINLSHKNIWHVIMLMSFIVPLLGFSLIPHQEPRFLIPCLVPLCILYANNIFERKSYFIIWLVINSVLIIFYGYIHQSGVTKGLFRLNEIISNETEMPMNIIFSRTYLPPRYLLSIPKSEKNIHIHDLSILNFPDSLDQKLYELKTENAPHFYLLIPSCLTLELKDLFNKHHIKLFEKINHFFPHFTCEDIISSLETLKTSHNFIDAFSMNLWKAYLM